MFESECVSLSVFRKCKVQKGGKEKRIKGGGEPHIYTIFVPILPPSKVQTDIHRSPLLDIHRSSLLMMS